MSTAPSNRVLIVDDNLQNLELLEAYLEALPCRVQTATDGLDALAIVERTQPDLILLDVMMPRMSGFEVCKKLKGNPATADLPVIMVTALTEVSDVERSVEVGADDFVSKPVNRQDLVERVTRLLKDRETRRRIEDGGTTERQ